MGSQDIGAPTVVLTSAMTTASSPIHHAPRGEFYVNAQDLPTQEVRTTAHWSPPTPRIDVVLRFS